MHIHFNYNAGRNPGENLWRKFGKNPFRTPRTPAGNLGGIQNNVSGILEEIMGETLKRILGENRENISGEIHEDSLKETQRNTERNR